MRIRSFLAILGLVALLLTPGCGTRKLGSGGGAGSGTNVPFTLAVTDQPPSGVTLLAFTITVTGAVLQPNNVSVLSKPVTIEVTQLQTDTELLANANIPQDTYTDLILTFSNPTVTIFNEATPIGTCAVGSICQISESISPTTVDFNTTPLPLAVTSGTPVGLLVDFSLNNLLQPDMTLNLAAPGGFNLSQFQNVTTTSVLGTATDIAGVVTAVGTDQFTYTTLEGISVTASTTSATQFFFPSCTANNLTCVTVGEIIASDLNLLGNGTIQAGTVAFEDSQGDSEISGTIVSVNSATSPPTFGIVVQGSAPTADDVTVGDQATVTIESTATFVVDPEVQSLESGFSFASVADLVVGQEVLVRVTSLKTSVSPIAISTTQIDLRQSEWTADVGLINLTNASFTVGSLPSLFTNAAPTNITLLTVDTTGSTQFENLTPAGVGGLAAQNPVSVKGPMFNTVGTIGSPTVVATNVVGRNPAALP